MLLRRWPHCAALVSLVFGAFTVVTPAMAGGYSFGFGSHYGGHHSASHFSVGYSSGHHYRPHYRSHYRVGYGHRFGHRRHHGHHGHHRRGIGAGEALAISLIGLGVGYAIASETQRPRERTVVTYPDNRPYTENWHRPPGTQRAAAGAEISDEECVKVRPYESSVEIEGQEIPTYGMACLTEEGVWRLGPPTMGSRE